MLGTPLTVVPSADPDDLRTPGVHRPSWKAWACLFATLLLAPGSATLASPGFLRSTAAEIRVSASADFATTARALAPGQRLVVEGLELERDASGRSLVLAPMPVFSADARIVVHQEGGASRVLPPPASVWLRGGIEGEPGSLVVLSLHERAGTRGIVFRTDGAVHLLAGADRAGPPRTAGLVARPVDVANEIRGFDFTCGTAELSAVEQPELERSLAAPAATPTATARSTTPSYWARVAIETDNEYLARFAGDTTAAAEYAGDLIAYASARYQAEVDTGLYVSQLTLWQAPDPWAQTSSFCALMEFGRHWNANHTDVDRTLAHFLSGKSSNAGIAWVGVLCNGSFNSNIGTGSCPGLPAVGSYGGDYGFTGGLDGDFDIDDPSVIWDIVAVTHEIGHNFNSKHTHCYAGIGGNAQPIDTCYSGESGCYAGSTSLPGPAGAGSGTIMSYCHFQSGGFSNIGWSLGTGHPWGVAPGRVPARMGQHVANQSLLDPGCLTTPPVAPALTVDRTGSGSGTVTSQPAGIDCGATCEATFDEDGTVTLTAQAAAGSVFVGWSGDCGGASGSCAVTMSGPRQVTATFADAAGTCMLAAVADLDIGSAATYDSCGDLEVGPDVAVTAGGDAWFAAGRTVAIGDGFSVAGALRVSTCGQNLCFTGPGPADDGCHPCVAAVCAVDAGCCDGGGWDAACVDLVDSVCDLTCE